MPKGKKNNNDFFALIKDCYDDFNRNKMASSQEILACLAQILKNHYKKQINNEDISEIKNEKFELKDVINAKKMFDHFYSNVSENIGISETNYKKIINWIIDKWNDIDVTNTNKSTDKDLVKVIQAFAKKLSTGPYVDLALGTGKILEGIKPKERKVKSSSGIPIGNSILPLMRDAILLNYGFDLDVKSRYLADALLNFKEDSVKINFENYNENDSINNVYKKLKFAEWEDEYPVFIFDPPLGSKSIQERPKEWAKNYTALYHNIFNSGKEIQENSTDSTSDVLFLANYLLNAPIHSHFIGIFPESILYNNTKEYPSLRKYLIEHSLNYIVALDGINASRLIVLIGTNDKSKLLDNITAIKLNNNIDEENLSNIIDSLNEESFENKPKINFSFTHFNRKNLMKNEPTYIISMPTLAKIEKSEIKLSASELTDLIFDKEKEMFRFAYRLRKKIKDNPILMQEFKEKQEQKENGNDETFWFEKDAEKGEQIAILLNKYYGFSIREENDFIRKIDWDKLKKHYKVNQHNLKEFFKDLFLLYKNSRIELNSFIINYQEKIKVTVNRKAEELFLDAVLKYTNLKYSNILSAPIYKEVYDTFCQYWFLNQDNIPKLRNKYSLSEITLTIKTLKTFGLLKEITDYGLQRSDYYMYDFNRPTFYQFDGGL